MRKNHSDINSIQRRDIKGQKMDDWDRKNLTYLVKFFDKAFPGVIKEVADQARKETVDVAKQASWKKDELNFTRRMAIPQGLWNEIKKGYPAILVDKRQFEQFLRWFPQFDILKR